MEKGMEGFDLFAEEWAERKRLYGMKALIDGFSEEGFPCSETVTVLMRWIGADRYDLKDGAGNIISGVPRGQFQLIKNTEHELNP